MSPADSGRLRRGSLLSRSEFVHIPLHTLSSLVYSSLMDATKTARLTTRSSWMEVVNSLGCIDDGAEHDYRGFIERQMLAGYVAEH